MENYLNILIISLLCGVLLYLSAHIVHFRKSEAKISKKIKRLSEAEKEISVTEFLTLRKEKQHGNKLYASEHDFAGIYLLHNKTKDMYYVGQGRRVMSRVNNHFTGKGNGDVYADYKYNDEFTIRFLSLENSGLDNLNDLERYAIKAFNACENGYNKNQGNKS